VIFFLVVFPDCNLYIEDIRFTLFFSVPFNNLKCIQQSSLNSILSLNQTSKILLEKAGYRGFYRAYFITFPKTTSGFGLYFAIYFFLKNYGNKNDINNFFYYFLIGGIAGNFF
jgi:hypothetical protein